ncbi:MAG: hypothetical protein J7J82_06435 [Staphylothermus sp.]|nr:hypothetical protein [Staphylothermus sp.]
MSYEIWKFLLLLVISIVSAPYIGFILLILGLVPIYFVIYYLDYVTTASIIAILLLSIKWEKPFTYTQFYQEYT